MNLIHGNPNQNTIWMTGNHGHQKFFISAMFQELRDPLQVIKGYMGILSNEAAN